MPTTILNKNTAAASELLQRHLDNLQNTDLLDRHSENIQNTELLERHLNNLQNTEILEKHLANLQNLLPLEEGDPSALLPALDLNDLAPLTNLLENGLLTLQNAVSELPQILKKELDPTFIIETGQNWMHPPEEFNQTLSAFVKTIETSLLSLGQTVKAIAETDLTYMTQAAREILTEPSFPPEEVISKLAEALNSIKESGTKITDSLQSFLSALPDNTQEALTSILEATAEAVSFIQTELLPVLNNALESFIKESSAPTEAFTKDKLGFLEADDNLLLPLFETTEPRFTDLTNPFANTPPATPVEIPEEIILIPENNTDTSITDLFF